MKISKKANDVIDENGWTPLHKIAQQEAKKKISPTEIETLVTKLLEAGADIHQANQKGETAFNIAAASSPVIGRLMTNHWLDLALKNLGTKKINEQSGSHNSTLAQYIAKWSNEDEIEKQLDDGIKKGMKIFVQNSSGWTPLHAACAMVGRLHAVRAFSTRYDDSQIELTTTEAYKTKYFESAESIFYDAGLSASDIAQARLSQAKTLPKKIKLHLQEYVNFLAIRKSTILKQQEILL